jgi:hypothetical protein
MSRSRARRTAIGLAAGFGTLFVGSVVVAQPEPTAVVLPAKVDAEGFSQLLIPIQIDGHKFWCSADSGGSRVLSLDLSKALNAGLQPNATGSSAGVGPEVRRDQRVRGTVVEIGSIVLRDITVVLNHHEHPTIVPDIDCVLGLGLLREYVIEFDYVTPAVRIFATAPFRAPPTGVAIPITIDQTFNPSTRARLRLANGDALDATLMIDTGASYYDVVLMKPFIDANRVLERIGRTVPRFTGSPGMLLTAARASAVAVGPFEIIGPVTALISTPSGGTYTVDGLLGTGFLRRFKVIFDYTHQQLYLERNGQTHDAQPFDASGLELRPSDDREYAIVAIASDSAAAEAGLAVGDVLKEIDGHRARDLTLGDIQARLNRAGTSCVVLVERRGHTQTTTLKLRRLL